MPSDAKVLGVMKPIGGGDPVPLLKDNLIIGRRASCDICLDFENVSGKHCELRFFHGLWHIRDLGSKNGTTLNGLKVGAEQSVLPDVELGVASHFYTIDYEPAGPASVLGFGAKPEDDDDNVIEVLDDDDGFESRKRKSLMELAGFETDRPRRYVRPAKAPDQIERLSVDEADFDDPLPDTLPPAKPLPMADDDDFFKLIEDDLAPKKP
jgi:hypothetical protein